MLHRNRCSVVSAKKVLAMFRMFIDEVGHHDLKSSSHPNERYLGLCCVIVGRDYSDTELKHALDEIKRDIFGRIDLVLHRREIVSAVPPFELLQQEQRRQEFNAKMLSLMDSTDYRVVTAVIDKQEHLRKYSVWRHEPYHYCLQVVLERYVMMLESLRSKGDVMVEGRGKKENRKLEEAYKNIYKRGSRDYVTDKTTITAERLQARLNSREIKIRPKAANVAGLQLADLLANPSVRSLICDQTNAKMQAEFGSQVVDILKKKKYRRSWWGKVQGYGTKWLP
jgi:hypothetical protein